MSASSPTQSSPGSFPGDSNATISMVLGLISPFCCFFSAIPAIILGALSLGKASPSGRTRAMVGMISGGAMMLVWLIVILVLQVSPELGKKKAADTQRLEEENKINDILKFPADFQPVYTVVKEEDSSYALAKRKSVKIMVPPGLSRESLERNMKHAARELYEKYKPDALIVFAYRWGDNAEYTYTAGRCIFAPYGEWEKASEDVPLKDYRAAIDFAPVYFKPAKKELAPGVKIELRSKNSKKVCVSGKKGSWREDDMIVCVKNGTGAEIVESVKEAYGGLEEMIRYKVKVKRKGRTYTGWIWDDVVHPVQK